MLLYISAGICIGYAISHISVHKFLPYVKSVTKYFFQPKTSSCLKKRTKNMYELQYVYNDKPFIILLPIKRGPKHIVSVFDDSMRDITPTVKPYLGPNEDFHSVQITPRHLNHKQLHFLLQDETMITFNENEIIYIKKQL